MTDLLGIESKARWFIVQTYVGFEDVVKKILGQKVANLGLSKKILEVYIPTKKITKFDKNKKPILKEEKVYPGYIYIKMYYNKETAFLIQNTQYVSKIAGTGDIAIPLEEGYVENMQKNLSKAEETGKTEVKTEFDLGDQIRVIDGPFKDMQGKISGIDKENMRVNVLLSIFDRETDVEIDMSDIEKLVQ